MPRPPHRHLVVLVLFAVTLLTGCGAVQNQSTLPAAAPGSPSPVAPANTSSSPILGNVHGGQQPVTGAHVYLFAAGTTGYGAPSLSLLDPTQPGVLTDSTGSYILTDPSGNFGFGGDYTCTAGQQVYVLVTGGNPGLPNNAINPALALMSILGTCPAAPATFGDTVPFLFINEVSTVASAFALSGFMADATHLSSGPSTNAQQGLENAFLTVNNLVDSSSGTTRLQSIDANGDVPQAEINTLADMLVDCVNSDGTEACSDLFPNAVGLDGTLPTDTLTAALNIARNPGANPAALFGAGFPDSPYQPTLTAAPNDWSIALTFYADNMVGPYFPAIDSANNIWYSSNKNNAIGESDKNGLLLSPATGYTGGGISAPAQLAVDGANRIWVANRDGNSLSAFSNSGKPISPTTGYLAPGLNTPRGLAIDASGNVWITNTGFNSITEFIGIATPASTPISAGTHGQRP
ncbi:hypothetical protein [Granulicella sp. S190]|uniref:hypothetical protein n=1 Tax=Granulicella sp. S190 TaxID=1747226 RepID=UPI00131BFB1C|nr:hypothetical protein [Granulicella sp. S190]